MCERQRAPGRGRGTGSPRGGRQPPAQAERRRYRLTPTQRAPNRPRSEARLAGSGGKPERAAETTPPPGPTCLRRRSPLSGSPLTAGRRGGRAGAASPPATRQLPPLTSCQGAGAQRKGTIATALPDLRLPEPLHSGGRGRRRGARRVLGL